MQRVGAHRRFVRWWYTILVVSMLTAGCAEPVSDAAAGFSRCMEDRAGFDLQGMAAGITDDGIAIKYQLADVRQAAAAERAARACVNSTSLLLGQRVFLEG